MKDSKRDTNKDLIVIIPVHNRCSLTRQCLTALRQQTVTTFNVIVVDDGSSDGTYNMVVEDFPEVILFRGDGNLWWSGATNYGIAEALKQGCRWVLTLNDDTVPATDFIEKMISSASSSQTSLLGAFAIDIRTKKPVYGGERINWATARYTRLLDILETEKWKGLHEVTHFPGRGLLIPVEVFQKIGMFESRIFPQSGADYDFTHRAIRAGYKIFCNFDAILYTYTNESGDTMLRDRKSIYNYYKHLFNIKGGGNLKRFVYYATRNTPSRYLVQFLILGILRRVLGYPFEWIKEIIRSTSKNIDP